MHGHLEKAAVGVMLVGLVGTLFFGSGYGIGSSRPSLAEMVGLGGVETVGLVVSLVLFGAGILVLGRPGAEEDPEAG